MLNRGTALPLLAILAVFLAACLPQSPPQDSAAAQAGFQQWPAEPTIRVLLVSSVSSISMIPRSPCRLVAGAAGEVARLDAGTTLTVFVKDGAIAWSPGASGAASLRLEPAAPGGAIKIRQVPVGVGWWWESAEDRVYEGALDIYPQANGNLEIVIALPLEEYLRGVVPSEIGATSPLEALKAQAVAARSEALQALASRKYAGEHYDICSDVECQAYSGAKKRTPVSDEAVQATRGLIMVFEGQPISAYYASNCGGHTEDIRNVWPDRAHEKSYWDIAAFDSEEAHDYDLTREDDLRRWLAGAPPAWCNPATSQVPGWAASNHRWERRVEAAQLSAWVAKRKEIGRVTGLRALRRGPSGRMIEAEFTGERGVLTLGPELAIRQVFDPPLKSAAFVVDAEGPAERPEVFIVRGAGWGHGVGMCQTGAIAMAHRGKTFQEILRHYYRTSRLLPAWEE